MEGGSISASRIRFLRGGGTRGSWTPKDILNLLVKDTGDRMDDTNVLQQDKLAGQRFLGGPPGYAVMLASRHVISTGC